MDLVSEKAKFSLMSLTSPVTFTDKLISQSFHFLITYAEMVCWLTVRWKIH